MLGVVRAIDYWPRIIPHYTSKLEIYIRVFLHYQLFTPAARLPRHSAPMHPLFYHYLYAVYIYLSYELLYFLSLATFL